MPLKSIVAAVLLATGASVFATGPGPLGVIDNTPISIANGVPGGIFQDVYSFSIVNPGSLSGGIISGDILGLTVTLQDATFAVVGSDASPGSFTFGGLAAGSYALNVLGYVPGPAGAYDGGFLATTVPEPGTYAMLLAGLAAVGFVASRRRQVG